MGPGSGCAPVSLTHMALASPSTALRWALQGHWCLPRCVPALGSRNRPFWLWMAHETEPPLLFFFLSLFNYLLRLSKAKGNCEIKSVKYNNIFKRTWIPLFLFATEKAPRRHRFCLISKQTIMEWQPVQPFEECQVEQPGERPGEEESEMPESKAVF